MPFELYVAFRYLKAKRKQTFISFITLISILGVILGVMALIVVLSVMSGFQKSLREKILGANAHIIVLNYEGPFNNYDDVMKKIKEVKGVEESAPFIISQVMLSSGERSTGVVLKGIDPILQAKVTNLEKSIKKGSLSDLKKKRDLPQIVIGRELSRNLGALMGDKINLIIPMGDITPMGVIPKVIEFEICGIVETGMFDYDSTMAYISLETAQKIFKLDKKITGIEVKVADIFKSDLIAQEIQGRLSLPFKTRDWKEMNKNLFSALRLEKTALFIILLLIILVAAFNIITTLIMLVMEKNKDIAILKSMGATSKSIGKIFRLQGVIIGTVGTGVGAVLGVLISLNLHPIVVFLEKVFKIELLARDVYMMDRFPSSIEPLDVILICLFSFLICYFATLYPAKKASSMDPAEILRYE
ncbi:MAG: lipoprotein-releasing ABC transporter permease subunit [Proteobacteria bacterium]|nr:lipoprotein-releasing ABC transporter permease subunit [Pseudomonadota bacterium]